MMRTQGVIIELISCMQFMATQLRPIQSRMTTIIILSDTASFFWQRQLIVYDFSDHHRIMTQIITSFLESVNESFSQFHLGLN